MIVRQDPHKYRTLRVYLFYRLVLAALLYLIFSLNIAKDQFGGFSPHLFQWSSLCYVLIALASLRLLRDKNAVNSTHKIATLLALDAIVLILLIHASGGLQSGLGYLLVITAAIASMFLHRQLALGFTALITLFLFAEAFYISSEGGDLTKSLFSAGTLGFLIFITSLTFLYLTERIKTSSQEAEKQTRYAKQLVQLAQHIVTRMRTGIVVIDEENRIELINESALQLLDLPSEEPYFGQDISLLSNLAEIILKWRTNPVSGLPQFHTLKAGHEIRINFASLTAQNSNKTILYLEDYRALMQQAQQLKLASLGRLTASIAHEVRNPLGAISHAAQLLSESDNIKDIDLRFTEIIVQHSARVNQIIENTLALSKRKEPKAELLELSEWIPEFIEEYSTAKTCKIHYINRGAHP
ncbi:MAG: two-component system sensor histidine kinase PilS (NtrC family), partial [Lentisphaeria bacterium]